MQRISTLMDGELEGEEARREIARLAADTTCRETWETYHLIGDAMRNGTAGASAGTSFGAADARSFCARFSERIALEPTVLAPRAPVTRKYQLGALAAAASVAAVAVVAWVAGTVQPDAGVVAVVPAPKTTVAQVAPPARPSALPAALQAPDAKRGYAAADHVHEYLLAHQGISPTTAIQGVTPYIRTVSNAGE
jgi:sigma-E factor negative regulatory protein RseA